MKRIIRSLKTVNYRLWLALVLVLLLPTIYQTVRIYFLGHLPDDWGVNIASQLQWLGLFYEVVQEALILPLFFILGKVILDKSEFANRIRSGLFITGLIYLTLSLLIIIFAKPLVEFMAQDGNLINQTVNYIRLETVAALFSTLVKFLLIVFITINKEKLMYVLLVVQTILSILLDTLLISSFMFSQNLGVNGIAITNIVVNVLLIIVSLFLLKREGINILTREKLKFKWLKEWFSVGKYSGLESLLRNLAFMIMIIRMVNVVSEQGNYWLANNFIWGWLLIPSLALSDLVKQEVAKNPNNIRDKTFGYISLTIIFSIIWLISIPLWKPFLRYVMNVNSYNEVFNIVLIQTGFYITFLFNSCIFDATFYGRGKTNYMLIQSIIIDAFYYGVMFILYQTGVFIPSILTISLMFGIGMLLDFIPTMIIYIFMLKKEKIKIDFNLINSKTVI